MSETSVRIDSLPSDNPGVAVIVGSVSPADVRAGMASIAKLATVIATLTGNSTVTKIVATFESLATQDWFVNLIVGAASLFEKGQHAQVRPLISSLLPPAVATAGHQVVIGALSSDDVTKYLDAVLQVATVVGTLTGNSTVTAAIATIQALSHESWFIALIVNMSGFVSK